MRNFLLYLFVAAFCCTMVSCSFKALETETAVEKPVTYGADDSRPL
jgi:hypothetical protein